MAKEETDLTGVFKRRDMEREETESSQNIALMKERRGGTMNEGNEMAPVCVSLF